MLIGMGPALRSIADGQMLIVDADSGDVALCSRYRSAAKAKSGRRAGRAERRFSLAAARECRSLDGTRVEYSPIWERGGCVAAVANGAEGCGCCDGILFIDRDTAPTKLNIMASIPASAAQLVWPSV